MKNTCLFVISLCLFALPPCGTLMAQSPKPNVLFIPIDDLNHWVGHLGRHPQTRTPHIDRLAEMGVSFNKAYCAAPACNPSRIALMSGLRPSTTGCYDNSQDWRPTVSEDIVLNATLLDAGYACYGTGKIYHGSYGNTSKWTEYHKTTSGSMPRHPSAPDDGVGGIKFCPLANDDEDMPDYDAVSYGIEVLGRRHERPFFLAVGLVKPHMPFSVPKKWFDLFPLESIELPPHRDGDLDDIPEAGVRMAKPEGDHAAILQSGRWKEAVQAYLATIAFCDAQVGRLLDALERSAYRDDTIICLWSDHGWSLGEKEHWRKFALWEEPTRTVFIWKVPGVTPAGVQSPRTVDFMSIYPTLCALTGVEKPAHVEGLDISPLLKNPNAAWDTPALTTFRKDNHSFRSEGWRYIRYADGSEELYNHVTDPFEWTNVAGHPEYAAIKAGFARHIPSVNAPELPGGGGENTKRASQQKAKATEREWTPPVAAKRLRPQGVVWLPTAAIRSAGRPFGEFLPGNAAPPGQPDGRIAQVKQLDVQGKRVAVAKGSSPGSPPRSPPNRKKNFAGKGTQLDENLATDRQFSRDCRGVGRVRGVTGRGGLGQAEHRGHFERRLRVRERRMLWRRPGACADAQP